MKKPKPKTVTVWAWTSKHDTGYFADCENTKKDAEWSRKCDAENGFAVGPLVKIELPGPEEKKWKA